MALVCSGMARELPRLGSLKLDVAHDADTYVHTCDTYVCNANEVLQKIFDTTAGHVCLNRPVGSWTAILSVLQAQGTCQVHRMPCTPLGPVCSRGDAADVWHCFLKQSDSS